VSDDEGACADLLQPVVHTTTPTPEPCDAAATRLLSYCSCHFCCSPASPCCSCCAAALPTWLRGSEWSSELKPAPEHRHCWHWRALVLVLPVLVLLVLPMLVVLSDPATSHGAWLSSSLPPAMPGMVYMSRHVILLRWLPLTASQGPLGLCHGTNACWGLGRRRYRSDANPIAAAPAVAKRAASRPPSCQWLCLPQRGDRGGDKSAAAPVSAATAASAAVQAAVPIAVPIRWPTAASAERAPKPRATDGLPAAMEPSQ
jgi:hypothetical protein